MPNTLTFTAPINVPNIRTAKIVAVRADEDAQQMLVDVQLRGPGGFIISTPNNSDAWTLMVQNGHSDGLAANGAPLRSNDVIVGTTVNNATAFTQCLTAYRTSRDSLLTTLATLGILPAGSVA